jgi:hypothetical protein
MNKIIQMKINHYVFSTILGILGGVAIHLLGTFMLPIYEQFKYEHDISIFLNYIQLYVPPSFFAGFTYLLPKIYPNVWKENKSWISCLSLFITGYLISSAILAAMNNIFPQVFKHTIGFILLSFAVVLSSLLALTPHPYLFKILLILPPCVIAAYIGTRNLKKHRIKTTILFVLLIYYIQILGGGAPGS